MHLRWMSIFGCLAAWLSGMAAEWNLPRDFGPVEQAAPPAVWQLFAVPRSGDGLEGWIPLSGRDWNPGDDRVMYHRPDGDVWSTPRLVVNGFGGAREMIFLTDAGRDPAAVFTPPSPGRYGYACRIAAVPADVRGAPGNAEFAVAVLHEDGTAEELRRFSWLDFADMTAVSGEVTLRPGDRLAFRKTASLADDFGAGACRVELAVTQLEARDSEEEWRAWIAGSEAVRTGEYRPMFREENGALTRFSQVSQPWAEITREGEGSWRLRVRPEGDHLLSPPEGNILLGLRIPESGNWRLQFRFANPGPGDVTGGDGGGLTVTCLAAGSELDTAEIARLGIPVSGDDSAVTFDEVLALQGGDRVVLRFSANFDAFGDLFTGEVRLTPSVEAGREIARASLETLIPQVMPPEQAAPRGAPLREGLYWLGVDGGWAASQYAEESVRLIRSLIPDLLVIGVASFPDRLPPKPAFYNEWNIPTISQTWGFGYENYLRLTDAFEYDWMGRNHAYENGFPLSGTAHGAAMPHPAFKQAFENAVRSAIRRGDSGFGFCDMVWPWGPGRGKSGYNPETVAAFRQSLAGRDEGLAVEFGDLFDGVMHFHDYLRFYTGGSVAPVDFGLTDWSEYQPLTRDAEARLLAAGEEVSAHWLLFDLLTHYEWLKSAQNLGRTAQQEGGFFQCMPNPEDLANGCDWLFLAALKDVEVKSEEYFNSPAFMDGAYYRFPYLRFPTRAPRQVGIVLESGGGGNALPYYTPEVSQMTAFEVTLASQADMLEGDFWVGHQAPLADCVNNPEWLERYRAILLYGLGFRRARQQELAKPDAQFVTYTSRRIFRTWGHDWFVWNYGLATELSCDALLASMGYVFEGRGEEALINDFPASELVFYSPSIPTRAGFQNLLRDLETGTVREAFSFAECFEKVVDDKLATRPMREVLLEWSFSRRDGRWQPDAASGWEVAAERDGMPALLKKTVGQGELYVLLFSPMSPQAGGEVEPALAAAGREMIGGWLAERGIMPRWRSGTPGLSVRLYRSGDTTLASAMCQPSLVVDGRFTHAGGAGTFTVAGFVPGTSYEVRTWPSGAQFSRSADAAGDLEFDLAGAAYEFFFIRAAGADWSDIELLHEDFMRAMTLDGMVK